MGTSWWETTQANGYYRAWLGISGPTRHQQCRPHGSHQHPQMRTNELGNIHVPSRDQALSLWSGNIDSKTLDYQRTNPREYQIVRTHTKETTWIKTQYHPTTSSTFAGHLISARNKTKIQNQSWTDVITISLSLKRKTNKQNSAQISPYTKLTQTTGPTLAGQKQKGKKNSTLKPGKRRPQTQ